MSLPYCFPRNEIDAISLTLSRETAFLEQGRQWGAAQVMISVKELSFPEHSPLNPVNAINNLPESIFEIHETNPSHIDISIMNNDKDKLRDLMLSGDLVDETSPMVDKFENVKYSKSSLKEIKGKKVETPRTQDWEYLNSKRVSCKADENSISCESEGNDESDTSSIRIMKESKLQWERERNARVLNNDKGESSSSGLKSAMKRNVRIVEPSNPILHTL
uniref:Movement protein n=1 Tax=Uromyces fabae virus TaxID=3069272 RepID=A0AA51U995_9VIRU|nr:putative movement protein [Uromyces fabae virus]